MIDKLSCRVPHNAPFTADFRRLYPELRNRANVFHSSRLYDLVADLRPYGFDVILHMYCKRDKAGAHKVELVECGRMSLDQMRAEISRVFDIDPNRSPVMRLDLAADVPGVPVNWFRSRVCVRHKRSTAGYIVSDMQEIGKGRAQTLYYGRRPNTIRIYNKVEEQKARYEALVRRANGDFVPSFQEFSGLPETGYVLTRVEREMGGARLSRSMVLRHLISALEFRPFDAMQIIAGGIEVPNPEEYTFETYGTGMFLRDMAEANGMQAMIRHCRRYSKGNTAKVLQKFQDFLPHVADEITLDSEYLNRTYQASVWRQLSGEGYPDSNSRASERILIPHV